MAEDEIEINLPSFGNISRKFKDLFKETKEEEGKEEKTPSAEIEINLDLKNFINIFRKKRYLINYLILSVICILAFYSRTLNVPHLERKYMISPDDPYVFYRYSSIIAEKGYLPKNDSLRYYPIGFDTSRELILPSYVAGYAYRILKPVFPDLVIPDIAAYYPAALLVVSLIFFFLFVKEIFNERVGLLATGFFAFTRGILFRTAGGFLEKEPLFLVFLTLSFYMYIKGLKDKKLSKKMIFGGLAGVFTGLAGLTSGLYLFIIYSITAVILVSLIFNKTSKENLAFNFIWFAVFILILSTSSRYDSITEALFFQVPLGVLLISSINFISNKVKDKIPMPTPFFSLLVGLVIVYGVTAVKYDPTWFPETLTGFYTLVVNPTLGAERHASSVSENQPPVFYGGFASSSWWGVFSYEIFFFVLGAIFLYFFITKKVKISPIIPTIVFTFFLLSLIFENPGPESWAWITKVFGREYLFIGLFFLTTGFLIFLAWKQKKEDNLKNLDEAKVCVLVLFVVLCVAANAAVRLFFMLSFPAAILSAFFIDKTSAMIHNRFKDKLYAATPYAIAFVIITINFFGASSTVSGMVPGQGDWFEAMEWVKENTPEDSIFIHWWDYGYMIQTMGERATILDPGNSIVQWNYDTGGHIFGGYNYTEVYDQLVKFHKPDYFLISPEDIPKFYQISRLGLKKTYFTFYYCQRETQNQLEGYEEYDMVRICEPLRGYSEIDEDIIIGDKIYSKSNTYLVAYLIPFKGNQTGPYLGYVYNTQYGNVFFEVNCMCTKENCTFVKEDGLPTCALPLGNTIINVPITAKGMLFTKLYIQNQDVPGFDLAYTGPTNIKIYNINYTELENAVNNNLDW